MGARGARLTAAKASSRPSPKTLLFWALPPQVRSSVSTAVWSSRARVAATSPSRLGAADQISATVPETWGVAMEVPLEVP